MEISLQNGRLQRVSAEAAVLAMFILLLGSSPMAQQNDPKAIVPLLPLARQPVGVVFHDPAFGTTLRRVSASSERGGFETQIYSQLQAFSLDDTYLLLTGAEGYVIRRRSDLTAVSNLDSSLWNVPRWHPLQAHVIVHFDRADDEDVTLQFSDVDSGQTTDIFTFPPEYHSLLHNQSFDEISEDGRWLAGMVLREGGVAVIFALNLENRELGALLPIPELYAGPCAPDPIWGEVEPDWVGVSPLGRYLVVQWERDGTSRCSGLETFDLETGEWQGRVYEGHQHGDLGIQPDGEREFFMTFELAAPPPDNGNPAIAIRLLPGAATASPPIFLQVLEWGIGAHISCRGPRGVCLVTADSLDSNGWNPFEGELFLQYTDGKVRRLLHHNSSSCGYWVQPRASLSRDGRYAVFASDWGMQTGTPSCDQDTELGAGDPYLVDLASGDPPNLIFAQWVNGQTGGTPNWIRIILSNPSDQPDSGTLYFQQGSGAEAQVPIEGTPVSAVPYSLPAWGAMDVRTDGTGPLQSGVVEIRSDLGEDSHLRGTLLFALFGHLVSVQDSSLSLTHRAFISVDETEDTALALYSPAPLQTVTLELTLLDETGSEVAHRQIVLQARQQLLGFADEATFFKDYFNGRGEGFKGTLIIQSEGNPVAFLSLIQVKATGALAAVSPDH